MMALEETTTIKRLAYRFRVAISLPPVKSECKRRQPDRPYFLFEVALLKCADGMRSHDPPTCLQRQVAPSKCSQKITGEKMNTIKDWITRLTKQEGSYLTKERLIQEIRKSNKTSLPVEYKPGSGVIIVAIPVPSNFQI